MIQFSVEFNYLVIASYLPVHKEEFIAIENCHFHNTRDYGMFASMGNICINKTNYAISNMCLWARTNNSTISMPYILSIFNNHSLAFA